MSDSPSVIRYLPNGPPGIGLTAWPDPVDPQDVVEGVCEELGQHYFVDPTGALVSGVWDATPNTLAFGPYPVHEFMLVLDGVITIIDRHGHEEHFSAGEAFVIPKGLPCTWKVSEHTRKFYVIFDDPSGAAAADPDELQVIRLDTTTRLPLLEQADTSRYIGEVPVQHLLHVFVDPTEQMMVGMWDTNEMHTRLQPFPRNELMHILEGSVTITGGDGSSQSFEPGDTFMVPKGTEYQWDSEGIVKKIYCMFIPK